MKSINRVLLCSIFVAVAIPGCHDSTAPDTGGTTPPPGFTLKLDPFITTGLTNPIYLTQPLNDARIFVVEQAGTIRMIRNGVLQTTPFLDITGKVLSGGE